MWKFSSGMYFDCHGTRRLQCRFSAVVLNYYYDYYYCYCYHYCWLSMPTDVFNGVSCSHESVVITLIRNWTDRRAHWIFIIVCALEVFWLYVTLIAFVLLLLLLSRSRNLKLSLWTVVRDLLVKIRSFEIIIIVNLGWIMHGCAQVW
jgi:hypothetical protein